MSLRGERATPMAEISHDPKIWKRGMRRLAATVLIHALKDLASGSELRRRGALFWFRKPDADGMSFEFCCAVLGRDANTVRHRVVGYFGGALRAFAL